MLVGQSAWATDTNATLEHTASTCCGTDNTVVSYSLDGEKAHYNQEGSQQWQGYAFAQYSFSLPTGEIVTSAKLTWTASTTTTARNHSIYYLNPGQDVDYDAISGQTAGLLRRNGLKTFIVTENFGGEATKVTDVTAAISAMVSAEQNYIVFQWTNNQGGGDLYGKGSATKAPTLVITTTAETTYSITFTETNGVTATVKIGDTDVTSGTNLTNGNYSFTATAAGYEAYNGNFTVSNADQDVKFTMTEATPVTSLTVKAKIGSSSYDIKTINLDNKYVGDSYSFNYPRYYLDGTSLYETDQQPKDDGYYKWNGTLTGNTVEIDYNTLVSDNVIYYAEGEEILTSSTPTSADIRCSDGKGGYFTTKDEPKTLKNLEAGRYKIQSYVWGGNSTKYTFKVGGTEVSSITTNGSLASSTSWFVVDAASDLTLEANENNSSRVLDCVYIEKYDTYVYNGDFSNPTWNAGWSGTGSNKKDAFVSNTNDWFDGKFAEMWAGNNTPFSTEANLNQTIKSLPAGTYTLSANIVNTVESSGGVLYAKVGDNPEITVDASSLSNVSAKKVVFSVSSTSDVVIGFKTTGITGGTGWIALDDFTLVKDASATAIVTSANWATLYTDVPLDFTAAEPTGLEAYTATINDGTVTLAKVESVPANTGVVLKGAANTYSIPVIASSEIARGDMLGSATAESPATTEEPIYVLKINSAGKAQFMLSTTGALGAGKAYLPASGTNSAKALSVVFADDPTGIANVNAAEATQPAKRIVNGKLVIEKNGKRYNAAGAEF